MENDTVSESRGGYGTILSYCQFLLPQCSLTNAVIHAFILFKPDALYMPGTVPENSDAMGRKIVLVPDLTKLKFLAGETFYIQQSYN